MWIQTFRKNYFHTTNEMKLLWSNEFETRNTLKCSGFISVWWVGWVGLCCIIFGASNLHHHVQYLFDLSSNFLDVKVSFSLVVMSVACVTDTLPISSVRRNLFKQQMVLLVSIFDIYVFSRSKHFWREHGRVRWPLLRAQVLETSSRIQRLVSLTGFRFASHYC